MSDSKRRGPMAWMVANRVTPNLLMLALLTGGLLMTTLIKQEVFPEFSLDMVTVSVAYPGATPEHVEQNIVLAIEEKVRDVSGIDDMTGTASEGSATVTLELSESADGQAVLQDVQQAISQITTSPDDAERPVISLSDHQRDVLDIQVYGDVSETALRAHAEEVRDRLLQSPDITQVALEGVRDYLIRVAIAQERLRSHGLTLGDVADTVAASAVDVAGGSADTASGEVLLRLEGRRDAAREFERIPLLTTPEGAVVRLGDVVDVDNGFEDSKTEATYDGARSIGIEVFRVGSQTPISVSRATRAVMTDLETDLPPSLHYAINGDSSQIYQQRLDLLLKNAFMGLVLVVLSLFLEMRLAFWVTMGIPTAFLGAFLFLPLMGVTINMISMFAFIIALGIVVDDAIVAGENIYEHRERGASALEAAVAGARDVAMPISFSILTNIVAFLPLLLVPGFLGKFFGVIPMVVITVFLVSWAEALAARLGEFAGTTDIDSGVAQGKNQVSFTLNDAGRSLGLTNAGVGAQVRAAFYGAEALRQLQGRNEVKIMVTLPQAERDSAAAVRNLLIRTPDATYVPLHQIADIDYSRAFTQITRRNGRRSIEVTANVTPFDATSRITQTLNAQTLPELAEDYPGLTYGHSGLQEDAADSLHALFVGFVLPLAGIYMLLAIPFASHLQPLIVMAAIPFAVVGAIIGHEIMGYSLSVISLMGVIALAGVVVNDSLVLIHYANTLRQRGENAADAVRLAAVRRFRPILLTTLTTFGGLAPMIFEPSLQARFMIPMAISLGFGILFATGITLVLVPCFYVIVEDLRSRLLPTALVGVQGTT